MAQLDAGDLNAEAQTAAIREVLLSDRIRSPLKFEPVESFCLAALIDPAEHGDESGEGPTTHDMHLARLFGSACMLATYPNKCGMLLGSEHTIPILVESTMALQQGWLSDLAELVRWFRDICDIATDDPQSAWFSNGTLSRIGFVMITAVQPATAPEAGSVAEAVDEILRRRRMVGSRQRWVRFIVDLDVFGRVEVPWIQLAQRTITNPPAAWAKEDRDAAAHLAHRIIDRELTHPFGIDI